MVTAEDLAARADVIAGSSDLRALLAHLRERARPLIEHMPAIPEHKALMSSDGGVCPDDGAGLIFDPWSPQQHRCLRCGKTWTGERHDRHWARYQHLWLSERAAHLATLAALGGPQDGAAAAKARAVLTGYAERYWRYPNRDNVLGPSRLFFSTYLESLWTCNYLSAAMLLRAIGQLDEAAVRSVNQVAEEVATIIGDYDEQFSNRQTWNNAALTALAVWFEDEELAQRALEGTTGLLEHLMRGFGRDGTWFEGENYHLFALRGLLTGAAWARLAGVDITADSRTARRLAAALRAPAVSALPDFTHPARKDSRFGASLAQPSYIEVWEIGLARLWARDGENGIRDELSNWLGALYRTAERPLQQLHESYLHDAPVTNVPLEVSRAKLSWWSLLEMLAELPAAQEAWNPRSVLLENQGLAILRTGNRYTSLECGVYGGGHGHPDRLHLTHYADGTHWLADPGTGSYVARQLFWYRSTLAHNAPRLDGESQQPKDAICESFDAQGDWAWARGRYGDLERIVVAGAEYVIDVLELSGSEDHVLELPWHIAGRGDVESKGRWTSEEITDEFVTRAERFVPDAEGPMVIAHTAPRARLRAHLDFKGELLRAESPGLPGGERQAFYVTRGRGRNIRMVTVLESHAGDPHIRNVRVRGDHIEVETTSGSDRHWYGNGEWTIERSGASPIALKGPREIQKPYTPYLELDVPTPVIAPAFRVAAEPPLDGTTAGFDVAEPLQLALEDQYRRSEDAYPGPADLSATAYAAWDDAALYIAVDVTKPDLCLRAGDAPPLRLDNEPDDIHSDGLQVYVAGQQEGGSVGYLVVPEPNSRRVRVSVTTDSAKNGAQQRVRGAWQRTDAGYRVTLGIPWPAGVRPHAGAHVRFDLIVNEMLPGRMRRVGQLVWSGGGGWVWLRGDRQNSQRFGILELVG